MNKKYNYIGLAIIIIIIIVITFYLNNLSQSSKNTPELLRIGTTAPNTSFLLINGTMQKISDYRGHIVLIYLVATWCSSCIVGTRALAKNIDFFSNNNVTIIELELYKDLGYHGPDINKFINTNVNNISERNRIIRGYATYNMTKLYDAKAYLDLYYLINTNGKIVYVNGAPKETMNLLKYAVNKINIKH